MANKLIQLQDAGGNKLFPKVVLSSIYENTTATEAFDFASLIAKVESLSSGALKRLVVDTLPAVGQPNIIYMILKTNDSDTVPNTGSVYNEYMYITATEGNAGWQLIGDTAVDLSGYATTGDLALKGDKSVVDGLVSVTKGYTGENAIKDAIALKGDKSVVDGLVSVTAGYTGEGAIETAIGLKADAANAVLTTGTIATVAAGDKAIVNRETVAEMIEDVTGSAVYYEDLGEIDETVEA